MNAMECDELRWKFIIHNSKFIIPTRCLRCNQKPKTQNQKPMRDGCEFCAKPTHPPNNQLMLRATNPCAKQPSRATTPEWRHIESPSGWCGLPTLSAASTSGSPSPTDDHREFEREPRPTAITVTPPNQPGPWLAQQPFC